MENVKLGAFACADGGAHQPGLTKREYFAAMAMQAYITNPKNTKGDIAEWSVKMADILLRELESK
jgi:hypothetical protein